MLRILKGFKLPVNDLISVYCLYVRPVTEYCATVWHFGLTENQKAQIERIQKRACRLMLGPQYYNYEQALETLGLPKLEQRREKLSLKLGKGMTHPSSPFNHWLPPSRSNVNRRTLRSNHPYTEVFCRTERYKRSALPSLISLLNANS